MQVVPLFYKKSLLFTHHFLIPWSGKPVIETPVAGEVGKEGDVTLKCLAYGFPAPQFTWKPSGKEVQMCKHTQDKGRHKYLLFSLQD